MESPDTVLRTIKGFETAIKPEVDEQGTARSLRSGRMLSGWNLSTEERMSLLRAKALLTYCTILVAAFLQTCCGHSTSYWFPNFLNYSEKCKFVNADTTRIL